MAEIYEITVHGCDDRTKVRIELTEAELQTISKVVDLVNDTAKNANCMPTMDIEITDHL